MILDSLVVVLLFLEKDFEFILKSSYAAAMMARMSAAMQLICVIVNPFLDKLHGHVVSTASYLE